MTDDLCLEGNNFEKTQLKLEVTIARKMLSFPLRDESIG
jgi:hypothetical protein